MRRLANRFISLIAVISTLYAGVALAPALHALQVERAINCTASCASHGQLAVTATKKAEEEEDELEPSPPSSYRSLTERTIGALYISIVLFAPWVAYRYRKLLLATQLRF